MVKKSVVVITLLIGLLIGLSKLMGITSGTGEQFLARIIYPLLCVQQKISRTVSQWYTQQQVLEQLELVTNERDALLKQVILLTDVKEFAQSTTYLNAYMKRHVTEQIIIAPILLRNFEGTHFFMIDAGELSGVKEGMIALYYQNLVGRVTEVYRSYSKVVLMTDPHCPVAAYTSQGVQGICRGYKQLLTILEYVDYDAPISKGDMIFSSGVGMLFPRGFALGSVIHTEGAGYHRVIECKPYIDFKKIPYCVIVPHTSTQKDSREHPL